MKGWITLHRRLLDNPIFNKPNYLAIWIYCLLRANYQDKKLIWNNKKIIVKRGSFITSTSKIAKVFGLSRPTVLWILRYLNSEQMIKHQPTNKFTVISVKNYGRYQRLNSKLNSSLTQAYTNNNNNKNKQYIPIPSKKWKKLMKEVNVKLKGK